MKWSIPKWAASVIGLPGAVSFRTLEPLVRRAADLEEELRDLDDDALRRIGRAAMPLIDGAPAGEQAARFLAVGREFSVRRLGLRPFDGQLLAACALLSGHAVELDTGEGKTLAGAIAAIGYVVSGRRVHVLSVNDYLAERDAGWMGPLYEAFGAQVGWIGQQTERAARRRAYASDVTYGSVSEVGFDVLRDRFTTCEDELVSPAADVAIIDEADAVLIDEAMVPLVLAGTSDEAPDDLAEAARLVAALTAEVHFTIDAERANAVFTDAGLDRLERELGGIDLYSVDGAAMLTRLTLALHARALMRRDVDYLVHDGAIVLINASRGRVAQRQRWPDGLHAAIELKEGLAVSPAGIILDSITVQDLAMRYSTLAGMSGTVVAVAAELQEFEGIGAGRVERHAPNIRVDAGPQVSSTQTEKFAQVVREVVAQHRTGRPVLVGTHSVAESEEVATRLAAEGIAARVLNAKNDADEAAIIARAGEFGAVTISTQMSGRGTDIRLGGQDGADRARVVAAGGLLVILTGRFPSRRLDAQLRGRAGRQGDPGDTMTFTALDDELVVTNIPMHTLLKIERSGADMTQRTRQRIVDSAQTIAEGLRLDRHRATWAYARATADQRAIVLEERAKIPQLGAANPRDTGSEAWMVPDAVRVRLPERLALLEELAGQAAAAATVRDVLLFTLDDYWSDHLSFLSEARDGIHLRALAGDVPVDEFHKIALRRFDGFLDRVFDAVAAFVGKLGPDDIGCDLGELGLRRPSATWTYLITDDPFGGPGDRFARGMGKLWRDELLGDEQ